MNASSTDQTTQEREAIVSTAPGFLQHFFASSRLHHLSTWKGDLTDYVIKRLNVRSKASSNLHEICQRGPSDSTESFRTIMHVDMDCFFASVGIKIRPHLKNRPVAVAHSLDGVSLEYSTSEIASCNYIARRRGVKNGMFIGAAKALVPDIVIIPYEFEQYDKCSKLLYDILIDSGGFVQAVSCDEAFVDVTFIVQENINHICQKGFQGIILEESQERVTMQIAEQLRRRIFDCTGCQASIGASSNILLARLCTTRAKPNGVCILFSSSQHHGSHFASLTKDRPIPECPPQEVLPSLNEVEDEDGGGEDNEKLEELRNVFAGNFGPSMGAVSVLNSRARQGMARPAKRNGVLDLLRDLPLAALPGVGSVTAHKCAALKLHTCGQLLLATPASLCAALGSRTATTLRGFCEGRDSRVLQNKPRASVGSDVNWGVRFTQNLEVEAFLREFCGEVCARLHRLGMVASHVTVNAKKRLYQGEPLKFLGCGLCADYSRSLSLCSAISSSAALIPHVLSLYKSFGLAPTDLRGLGIHLRKLAPAASMSHTPSQLQNYDTNPSATRPCAAFYQRRSPIQHNPPPIADGMLKFFRNQNITESVQEREVYIVAPNIEAADLLKSDVEGNACSRKPGVEDNACSRKPDVEGNAWSRVDDGVPRYWQGSHEKQETSVTSSGWSVGAMHGRAIDSSSSYSCSCSGRGMSVPACVNRKRDSGLSSPGADSSLPVSTGGSEGYVLQLKAAGLDSQILAQLPEDLQSELRAAWGVPTAEVRKTNTTTVVSQKSLDRLREDNGVDVLPVSGTIDASACITHSSYQPDSAPICRLSLTPPEAQDRLDRIDVNKGTTSTVRGLDMIDVNKGTTSTVGGARLDRIDVNKGTTSTVGGLDRMDVDKGTTSTVGGAELDRMDVDKGTTSTVGGAELDRMDVNKGTTSTVGGAGLENGLEAEVGNLMKAHTVDPLPQHADRKGYANSLVPTLLVEEHTQSEGGRAGAAAGLRDGFKRVAGLVHTSTCPSPPSPSVSAPAPVPVSAAAAPRKRQKLQCLFAPDSQQQQQQGMSQPVVAAAQQQGMRRCYDGIVPLMTVVESKSYRGRKASRGKSSRGEKASKSGDQKLRASLSAWLERGSGSGSASALSYHS